jgi:hypothetical protein
VWIAVGAVVIVAGLVCGIVVKRSNVPQRGPCARAE